jgi:NTE family protein
MKNADQRTRQIIEQYFDISGEQQNVLLEQLDFCSIRGGEWLFHQGDASDSLYLLIRGRLQVWLEADGTQALETPRLIGRVTPGDSVGEIGLLTGSVRSAGIRAIRDSRLIRITRHTFDRLSENHPSLVMKLAGRAAALVQKSPPSSGSTRNLSTVALLPLDGTQRSLDFCRELVAQLSSFGDTRHLTHGGLQAAGAPVDDLKEVEEVPEQLVQWVESLEDESRLVVFQCEPEVCQWTHFALRQADLIILVGEAGHSAARRSWEIELGLDREGSITRRMLVLLQAAAETQIRNTADWFLDRELDFHLHVRSDRPDDIARVARVIGGKAIGLVLGAGASRGFAHLGVYQALVEADIPIDWIGGTSIGAIMGATMANDWTPGKCIETVRTSFVGGKPFSDFTLPLVSLLAGRRMQRLLRAQTDVNIEDLPLPFFCISSSLDDGSPNFHRTGLLSRALEATASMPGIFPPTVVDRHLAVDGSVLNSLPVDIMWQQPVGQVVAIDLAAHRSHSADYEDIPSAWALLWSRILPMGKRYRVPGLMTVMLKSTELATMAQVKAQGARASLLLSPDVRRFGLTEVKAFERIVQAGYEEAKERIPVWLDSESVTEEPQAIHGPPSLPQG